MEREGIALSLEQAATVRADEVFAQVYERWAAALGGKALWLAHHDEALAADLMQEAAMALWELDPTRYGVDDAPLMRTVMVRKMKDVANRELWRCM